jgi:hypothetical protein
LVVILQILNVPGRKYILIHPANEVLRELKGCIAPVRLTGAGKGICSLTKGGMHSTGTKKYS